MNFTFKSARASRSRSAQNAIDGVVVVEAVQTMGGVQHPSRVVQQILGGQGGVVRVERTPVGVQVDPVGRRVRREQRLWFAVLNRTRAHSAGLKGFARMTMLLLLLMMMVMMIMLPSYSSSSIHCLLYIADTDWLWGALQKYLCLKTCHTFGIEQLFFCFFVPAKLLKTNHKYK